MLAFRGSFTSTLRWHQFDALWDLLRQADAGGWYLYAVGEPPPGEAASAERFGVFLDEMAALLKREHDEDYCGIVYADDLRHPAFIKIFDPHNLGVSCGYSDNPPLPGWIISRLQPVDLPAAMVAPAGRRRWWRRLFG
ncbi:MAG: hypothetical protein KDI68_16390 [Gammaproteobacteria bacterium]|nr:hypothetical protein [Gammaproteobacteria bacterium]